MEINTKHMKLGIRRRRRRQGQEVRNGKRRDVQRGRQHVERVRAAAVRAALGRRRGQHRQ